MASSFSAVFHILFLPGHKDSCQAYKQEYNNQYNKKSGQYSFFGSLLFLLLYFVSDKLSVSFYIADIFKPLHLLLTFFLNDTFSVSFQKLDQLTDPFLQSSSGIGVTYQCTFVIVMNRHPVGNNILLLGYRFFRRSKRLMSRQDQP